ncbi:MAG: isoprenylcysteine carboxylmethyltransferase family protein [Geobacteraceae bacterium]
MVQVALFVLVVFGPHTWTGAPTWTFPYTLLGSIVGGVLLLTGGLLALVGIFKLGANFTIMPRPKDEATLVITGPYRIVRHPIYSCVFLMSLGWAFWLHSWLTIGYAIILSIFLDVKSRREEEWLKERFPDYAAYQKRVRKLIPFIY